MFQRLSGNRTYILTALGGLLTAIYCLDLIVHEGRAVWLTEQAYAAIAGFLGFGGLATNRAGSKADAAKVEEKVDVANVNIVTVSEQVQTVDTKVEQADGKP